MSTVREGGSYTYDPETGALTRNLEPMAEAPAEPPQPQPDAGAPAPDAGAQNEKKGK